MGYTHVTMGQAKTQLAALLQDPGKVFFVDAELGIYVTEALRTFQVLTGYWRTQTAFTTTAATTFYSLPAIAALELDFTVTGADVITLMEYHLLEPINTATWIGTEQFTLTDLINAYQRRRNQFLAEAGCYMTYATQVVNPATERIALPDTTIDIRRAAWYAGAAPVVYTLLWREDEWVFTAFDSGWGTSTDTPGAYSVAAAPPITIQLYPPPAAIGNLELITVRTGANVAAATLIGIPDDFTWIPKWGALADLLSKDGPATDPARAKYCEERYRQGVQLANFFTSIYQADISGNVCRIDAVSELDAYNPNWQNEGSASIPPNQLLTVGPSMIGLYPAPTGAGTYTVTLDYARNAPIPATDNDYLELGREEFEAVLNYAQHLAMFKVSGLEFEATFPYWENLIRIGINYGDRRSAAVRYHKALAVQEKRDFNQKPRIRPRKPQEAS